MRRRTFLVSSLAAVSGAICPSLAHAADSQLPTDNPTANLRIAWTEKLPWGQTLDVTSVPGANWDERCATAQRRLHESGGGVLYFPAGTYEFRDSIALLNGIVIRGAAPNGSTKAQDDKFSPATKFEFPKYSPKFSGDGSPISAAFKGIYLADPASATNCGVVHLAINRGHVRFLETAEHRCGANRLVYGCSLRNAAVADPAIPDLKLGQPKWARFTARHHAAIDVKASENILVANNRLPRSGDDNFTMDGYVLKGAKGSLQTIDGVVFDYDNRPGMYVNSHCVGGAGGSGNDGTPETHPWGFRRGIVIRDNYIYNTGRMGIGFCGDGVLCANNVIRIAKDVWRPTVTGLQLTFGSSTNDNRAIEMRGWRWVVENNDYEVHRNWAADRKYAINDGEGLMHEDHCNSTVKDSRLSGNRGNSYLSIYKCGEIDGLIVEDNDIRVDHGEAIFVVANRNSGPAACRNVTVANNRTAGGGIVIAGSPASNNTLRDNRHTGANGRLKNEAQATLKNNVGYEMS